MTKQKAVSMIIVRDKHKTHTNKLNELVGFYKLMNPDNASPDELDKINHSSMVRMLIDDGHDSMIELKSKLT